MTRTQWLEERKNGIGGSDAAAIIARNPYKTNIQLWEEKTGRRETEDISDNEFVKYGIEMEELLRNSFKIKNPQYEVKHEENTIIKHPKYPFLFASLDGILIDKETGEMGILEIKTSNSVQTIQKEKWKDKIPDHYYCQVLHYLNVTGFSFVKVFAELRYDDDYYVTKCYEILKDDIEEELKYLEEKEVEFWTKYVEKDVRPPLVLPEI